MQTQAGNGAIGSSSERIHSIDVLRGLTILAMIFVNDIGEIESVPWWLKHFPSDKDGMTFVDVIFPAFLFMVGMVIPTALNRRKQKGDSVSTIWSHILVRTLGLLIIGVFMVNTYVSGLNAAISLPLWSVLVCTSVILVWRQMPRDAGTPKRIAWTLRVVGIMALIALALVYRVAEGESVYGMRPMWWGILGLIGWAYLTTCLVYTLTQGNLAGMMGAVGLLLCVFMGDRAGVFSSWTIIKQKVDLGSMIGSHGAITAAGALLGTLLLPGSKAQNHAARIRAAVLFGFGMAAAAILLRPIWGISKVKATPSWCLWGAAWTCWCWAALYWIIDVRGWKKWTWLLGPAGENPLMAYILAPLIYSLFQWLDVGFYSRIAAAGVLAAITRGVLFAFAVTWLTAVLKKIGIRLAL